MPVLLNTFLQLPIICIIEAKFLIIKTLSRSQNQPIPPPPNCSHTDLVPTIKCPMTPGKMMPVFHKLQSTISMLTLTIIRVKGRMRWGGKAAHFDFCQGHSYSSLTPVNTILNLHKGHWCKHRSRTYSHIASYHTCPHGTHVYIQYV